MCVCMQRQTRKINTVTFSASLGLSTILCSKSYISSNTIFNCSFTPKRLHRERSNHLFYKNFNFIHKSIQTCKFSICQYLISAREEFQNMRDPAMNFTEYTYSPSMKAI